jgi:hypothetical protein
VVICPNEQQRICVHQHGEQVLVGDGGAARPRISSSNPPYLNAEDATTLDAMEIAVDAAILDPSTEIAVIRAGAIDHPKYRGSAFSAPASTSRISIAARSLLSGSCSATSAMCTRCCEAWRAPTFCRTTSMAQVWAD